MIETKNLTKTFDNFTAVDSLDLKIETGEFFGLLGPNGAGKTTTISLLSTLLLPTKGEILIDGQKLTRNRCGCEITGEESCFFSQELHGILCESCARGKREARRISPSALYAMRYIATASLGKLYTFCVDPDVLLELEQIIHLYTARNTDRKFKSLQILEVMK